MLDPDRGRKRKRTRAPFHRCRGSLIMRARVVSQSTTTCNALGNWTVCERMIELCYRFEPRLPCMYRCLCACAFTHSRPLLSMSPSPLIRRTIWDSEVPADMMCKLQGVLPRPRTSASMPKRKLNSSPEEHLYHDRSPSSCFPVGEQCSGHRKTPL